jgi:hypothetical protein
MRTFYPELSGKGINVNVDARSPLEADGPLLAFYIQVSASDQSVVSPNPNPSSADRVRRLAAHFQFDGRDRGIFLIFANGSFLNDKKQQALAKLVDQHHDWSDTQMTDALSGAGAKYGPNQKEALLAQKIRSRLASRTKSPAIIPTFCFVGTCAYLGLITGSGLGASDELRTRGFVAACFGIRPQSSSVGRVFRTSEAFGQFTTGSFLRIFPSRKTITRFANCATSCSWVTSTIVKPLSFKF